MYVAADEDEIRESVTAYLEQNGFGGWTPTGTENVGNGWGRLDYYVDEKEQKYCFILWFYDNYEKDDKKVTDAVCTVKSLADARYRGAVLIGQDEAGGVTREREYDEWGRKCAEVSYRYREGIVFPFITQGWNLDEGEFLCRNQMMTFSEAYSIFDDTGKFVGTLSQDENLNFCLPLAPYLPYNCTCIYGENGRLETLKEELQEDDIEAGWRSWGDPVDYSGRIDFLYSEEGTPMLVDYLASEYTHGSYKSSGLIRYDEQGRMIYDSFYVTHGGDVYLYLYRENEECPWARIDWCSMVSRGFETVTVFEQNTER